MDTQVDNFITVANRVLDRQQRGIRIQKTKSDASIRRCR